MSAFDLPSCPECYLVVADMTKHRFIEHAVEVSDEDAAKIKSRAAADAKKTAENAKIDMVYMGNKGPTQPK
jgi:hypothetical protein